MYITVCDCLQRNLKIGPLTRLPVDEDSLTALLLLLNSFALKLADRGASGRALLLDWTYITFFPSFALASFKGSRT